MAVLPMKRISIYGLKKDRKQILELVQRMGAIEVKSEKLPKDKESVFTQMDTSQAKSTFETSIRNLTNAVEILDSVVKPSGGLLASLNGKDAISVDDYYETAKDAVNVTKTAARINALKKSIDDNKADIIRHQTAIEALKPWVALDISMRVKGTASTSVFIGTLPDDYTEEKLKGELAKALPDVNAVDCEVISHSTQQSCIFVICHAKFGEKVEAALRNMGLSYPAQPSKQSPSERIKILEGKIRKCEEKIAKDTKEIEALAPERQKLLYSIDYFTMRTDKYEVLGGLWQSAHVFIITGYIPAEDSERIKAGLESKFNCFAELDDVSEKDTPPVKLKNNKFSAPVESVIESYSLPGKGEMDPTSITSIFYYVLFGMMLSDAAYGLIMFLGCAFILLKFKNLEEGMKKFLTMFFYCGISTTFWGFMFGSFFGDAIDVVAKTFFHYSGPQLTPCLWFAPMEKPMQLLMFSFLLGIIHLFAGLACSAYQSIRAKKYLDAVYDVLLWYLLIGGLLLLLLAMPMFAEMTQLSFTLPSVFAKIGGIMAGIGAVGIVLTGGRESKSPVKRLLKGLYALYGVSSWLSDILSYSRLLALGLATGVIAQVFNQMGSMLGGNVVGAIVFILVFLIGQTLNIGINALGAYVHCNRLQFVEFFGKFYSGGGEKFSPFEARTKYFKIKD
ncbi:MAG: V-type ATP synthase subunit I [Clostridia bacterium]|nr:V-type ATP synthase subunit I [Clostridia bacterium]